METTFQRLVRQTRERHQERAKAKGIKTRAPGLRKDVWKCPSKECEWKWSVHRDGQLVDSGTAVSEAAAHAEADEALGHEAGFQLKYAEPKTEARVEVNVWQYGITTVPSRFDTTLPGTVRSLAAAGFKRPFMFVDGPVAYPGYDCVTRATPVRTAGNWVLAALELFHRNPFAERFAIFQDDLLAGGDLMEYLSAIKLEPKTYWNLYSHPENELFARGRTGFYPSNQAGRGAVGLVFSNQGLRDLLSSEHLLERCFDTSVGHPARWERRFRTIDGGIVEALKKKGYTELVHNPSLITHTGDVSSMGNQQGPKSRTFRGEGWSLLQLLSQTQPIPRSTSEGS